MKYNKLAYKIYKSLDEKTQKCLGVEYDIERVDNTENKKWNDRFLMSFCNWLWMKKFKKNKTVWISLMQQIHKLKNDQIKTLAEGPFPFIKK
jgi:hypothetical protein